MGICLEGVRMKTRILVAARDGAKLFEQEGNGQPLIMLSEFSNPEGRMKARDLVSDKPGRSMEIGSKTHHSFSPHEEPKEHLLSAFLDTLASTLDRDVEKKLFDRLVLIAEPHMMGKLRAALTKKILAKVETTIIKDLFHSQDDVVRAYVENN